MAIFDATFRSGGLASNIDTNTMIDQLTKLEAVPIDNLRTQQTAIRSQVSVLGTLASQLAALETATNLLGSQGVVAVAAGTGTTSFSIATGSSAPEGSYAVQVNTLASAAKSRSQAFASGSAPVTGGILHLSVKGTPTDLTIPDGTSLNDVAALINHSGAAVTATVLSDGTSAYLSINNRSTGYTPGQLASTALGISFSATGTQGQAINSSVFQPATNATFSIDGLDFTRQSNSVSDALPGVTLNLKTAGGAAEDLVLSRDQVATKAKLQAFVDAYNAVATTLSGQLRPAAGADRSGTLASDSYLRSVESSLQGFVSKQIFSTGGVRSLADLGLQTQKDGTLTINDATLTAGLARDATGANALFSTAATGLAAQMHTFIFAQTSPVTGLLAGRTQGMADEIKSIDRQADEMQIHVDSYKQGLIDQFTALESLISQLKSTGNFLTQQFANYTASGK